MSELRGAAAAVIPAAGIGRRMGAAVPKQYLELGGGPLFIMTLETFARCSMIAEVILVVPEAELDTASRMVRQRGLKKVTGIVAGGPERQDSVANGLQCVSAGPSLIAVHDGVRPLVTTALIERCLRAAARYGAAVPCLPLTDTVKRVDGSWVGATVDRSRLCRVQTPQCFRRDILQDVFDHAALTGIRGTDEAALAEQMGRQVRIVRGEETNIKITAPADISLAAYLLECGGEGTEKSGGC